MHGMDRTTGGPLSGEAHLAQSIADILGTPRGARVMRRRYGSEVASLLDAPLNGQTLLAFYAAIAEALAEWEPRVTVDQIKVVGTTATGIEIELSGTWTDRAGDAGSVLNGAMLQAGAAEVSL